MSEPLDFSSIGSKPATAPPAQAPEKTRRPKPPKAPKQKAPRQQGPTHGPKQKGSKPQGSKQPKMPRGFGTGPSKRTIGMAVVAVVAVAVAGFVVLDRGDSGGATDSHLVVNAARFCELAKTFDGLTSAPDVSAAGVSKVFTDMGVTVGEMQAVAPPRLRPDVTATVGAYRAAAQGNLDALQTPSFKAKRQRVGDYIRSMCDAGSGSGEQ